MTHPERKIARRYGFPHDSAKCLELTYGGEIGTYAEIREMMNEDQRRFYPEPPEYQVYFGDIHCHTNLSDGFPSIDSYYQSLRDNAKLDFAAISDHDHGGLGKKELWKDGIWDLIKQKAKEYYRPGEFTTLLAYERDSAPWFPDLVIYYDNHDGEMFRGQQDGAITRKELRELLSRDDLLLVPHDTQIRTDFLSMELEDMPPLIQVYSRGSYAERTDLTLNVYEDMEGGHWQDALKMGARMGCMGASDDHERNGGLTIDMYVYPNKYPGLTGVWAKENTLPAIFEALKARRCYAFMGGRMTLDFRINGHYMGEEFKISENEDKVIYFHLDADAPIDYVTVVKNCRDYRTTRGSSESLFFDYKQEQDTDCYYIRAKLKDGRYAWSSPIWVSR